MNRITIAFCIFSFVAGLLVMWLLIPKPVKVITDDSVLIKSLEQKDARIKSDSLKIIKLTNDKEVIRDSIIGDRIKYKTIYEKIPYSTSADRRVAFDTLLTK